MIRLLGGGMILLAVIFYLDGERRGWRQQEQLTEELIGAVEAMETAVRWERCPLPESIRAQENRPAAGSLFREIHTHLERGMTLQTAWETSFRQIRLQRLSEILCAVSLSGDALALQNRFACAADEIRAFQTREREKQRESRKVRVAASLSAAGVIVILLL